MAPYGKLWYLPGMRWEVCIRTFMVSVKYFQSTLESREEHVGEDEERIEMEEWEEIRLLASNRERWRRQEDVSSLCCNFSCPTVWMFVCFLCPEGVCGRIPGCGDFTPYVIITLIFCLPLKCTSSSRGRKCVILNWGLTRPFLNTADHTANSLSVGPLAVGVGLRCQATQSMPPLRARHDWLTVYTDSPTSLMFLHIFQ